MSAPHILGNSHSVTITRALRGGYALHVSQYSNSSPFLHAAVADDEGLIEWFADQLGFGNHKLQARPPNLGPEAEAAGADAPAADDRMVTLRADDWNKLAASLRPLVALVTEFEGRRDNEAIIGRGDCAVPYRDVTFSCAQLRRIAAAFAPLEIPF